MIRPKNISGFIIYLALFLFTQPLYAATKASPIEVFADHVDVDFKKHTTYFSKNVKILFDSYTLTCENAELILDQNNQHLLKIIMQGNVLIQSRGSVLKGKRVILDVATKRLQIEGQVYSRMQFEKPIDLNFN